MSAAKMTEKLREKLTMLEGCTAPWLAVYPPNIRALRSLTRAGYASETMAGWVITDAGRAALHPTQQPPHAGDGQ